MTGSASPRPLILLGADGAACEDDACLLPGAASEQDADSSPAPATDR